MQGLKSCLEAGLMAWLVAGRNCSNLHYKRNKKMKNDENLLTFLVPPCLHSAIDPLLQLFAATPSPRPEIAFRSLREPAVELQSCEVWLSRPNLR